MSSTKPTFPLYGYERFFAMAPHASAKLAHVLTIRGDITVLVPLLARAVMQTFNQHPKMRTVLLPGVSPQKAMVCQPIVDVAELTDKQLVVTWREKEEDSTEWMGFVERECQVPIDREHDWPFTFHVFADKTTQRFARIVLLSDHYMCDSTSGAIVLNDLLQHAAKISSDAGATAEEKALLPSLYEHMHNTSAWLGVLTEAFSKWVLEPVFNFDHAGFTPVLPVDAATQSDFAGHAPVPANTSRALFAKGTAACMQKALQRCEQEVVSLDGLLTAATLLAYGLTQHHGNLRSAHKISIKTDVAFDMRHVVRHDDAVGLYTTAGNLVSTASEGTVVHEGFWDLARRCDHERRATLAGHELKLQSTYVHETLNAENVESTLQVKNCILSDATIANTSLYMHPKEVSLTKDEKESTTLHVESLHVYNSLPSLSSACMIFLSGVTSFNYALMTKLTEPAGRELFHWLVETVERAGEITPTDTLLEASERLTRMESAVAPLPPAPTQSVPV